MDKRTTTKIIEETRYITADGEVFDCEIKAIKHEEYLVLCKKMKSIKTKSIDEDNLILQQAYYIMSEEEYLTVTKYLHISTYQSIENQFAGKDWYFFYKEYNPDGADKLWRETLTEKKKDWEEFYTQFIE